MYDLDIAAATALYKPVIRGQGREMKILVSNVVSNWKETGGIIQFCFLCFCEVLNLKSF